MAYINIVKDKKEYKKSRPKEFAKQIKKYRILLGVSVLTNLILLAKQLIIYAKI